MIWIVEKDGIVKKKRADITVKEAGQKQGFRLLCKHVRKEKF